jgi:hypothetical protein
MGDKIGEAKIQIGLEHVPTNLKNVERMMNPALRKNLRQAIEKEETPEMKEITSAITEWRKTRSKAHLLERNSLFRGEHETADEESIRRSITEEVSDVAEYQAAIEEYKRLHPDGDDIVLNGKVLDVLYALAFIVGVFGAGNVVLKADSQVGTDAIGDEEEPLARGRSISDSDSFPGTPSKQRREMFPGAEDVV